MLLCRIAFSFTSFQSLAAFPPQHPGPLVGTRARNVLQKNSFTSHKSHCSRVE